MGGQNGKGVRFADFNADGLSNTILIGEKHVPPDAFGAGWRDNSLYDGEAYPSCARPAGPWYPLATSIHDQGWRFGSYHTGVCQFVFGDGSVRAIRTTVDPDTLGLLAQRNDGQVIPAYE